LLFISIWVWNGIEIDYISIVDFSFSYTNVWNFVYLFIVIDVEPIIFPSNKVSVFFCSMVRPLLCG